MVMKRQLLVVCAVCSTFLAVFFGNTANAQAPYLMSFQAVIRDTSGVLVVSSPVGMQISILQGSSTGTAVYVERQTPITNSNGLASIMIGAGTVMSGSFDSVNWAAGPFYIKCDIDPLGGTTYTITATQQLVSVPYAFYAAHSGDTASGALSAVTTDSVNAISWTSATCFGTLASCGSELVLFRGFCVDTAALPAVTSSYEIIGSNLGSFQFNITGLQPNTTYHVRSFATNVRGTVYGDTMSFTTAALTTPTLTTDSAWSITNTSAMCGGVVTSDGGSAVTARGICWNTTGSPTIASSTSPSGAGIGAFGTAMSSLTPVTTYYVRAYATNAVGTAYGPEITLTTVIYSLAGVITDSVTAISYHTAVCGVDVVSDGSSSISYQGVCYSTSPMPTLSNPHVYSSIGVGDFPVTLAGLTAGTTYYARAFCQNTVGTSYGAQVTFNTLPPGVPILTTNAVVGVTAGSATSGGDISDDGGSALTARGVCWGLGTLPTIDSSHTTDGTDTGLYNSNMTGLTPLTTYYVRAYATNATGTGYGTVYSFTTDSLVSVIPGLPVVGTTAPVMATGSTASAGGFVLSSPGSSVTAYGVCWSASPLPTLSGSHTTDGSGLGYFTSTVTGLSGCASTYYVRAYATNASGTAYGNSYTVVTGLLPTVADSPVTATTTTATTGGYIATDGGCPITQRGVVWCIAAFDSGYYNGGSGPVLGMSWSSYTTDGTGSGGFMSHLTGLSPGVTYHVCSYAVNNTGTVYGPTQTFTTPVPTSGHYIGENFAGGYIFYIDSTGEHGMVCATADLPYETDWGCPGTLVTGTDTAFGTGFTNTAAIIANCTDTGAAALKCSLYHGGGYSDWFLPSYCELNAMYNSLMTIDLGNLLPPPPTCPICGNGPVWWSSSQFDPSDAWLGPYLRDYYNNSDELGDNTWGIHFVRPCRKF
jgi:hypothetical protein